MRKERIKLLQFQQEMERKKDLNDTGEGDEDDDRMEGNDNNEEDEERYDDNDLFQSSHIDESNEQEE